MMANSTSVPISVPIKDQIKDQIQDQTKDQIQDQSQDQTIALKIAQMTEEDLATLAKRLEQDAYTSAFEGLQDWHLLRAIAFQRPELAEPYVHLLDLEPFDES
jgi:Protein of unknown function (DUF2555)